MGEFLLQEKHRQIQFLRESGYFSLNLSTFTENPQRLPNSIASENLSPTIRHRALDYFEIHNIQWPRGSFHKPSPDLCDVTVNCINFFFPFTNSPAALSNLLSFVFPSIKRMIAFEDNSYVAFLWPHRNDIGHADAAVYFLRKDFRKQMVLIHWNYCEAYTKEPLPPDPRLSTLFDYHLPINKEKITHIDPLLYQPYFNYLKFQMLAQHLEKTKVLDNDLVTVLNIMPLHNKDLLKVVSPELEKHGINPTQIWQNITEPNDHFDSVFTENLFGHFNIGLHPELLDWWLYITRRYPWLRNK